MENEETSVWPWVIGIASGVGLWFLLRPKPKTKADMPGVTQAAPMPTVASPARFADLTSVALRLDQVKTLYRSGRFSPEQALAEAGGLAAAANSFSLSEGEVASEVYAKITAFENEVTDYIQMQRRGIVGPTPT